MIEGSIIMPTKHHNKMSAAEDERLNYLIEECSEVIHIASKINRHGYDSFDPTSPLDDNNRVLLEREIADVLRAFYRMAEKNDIDSDSINKHCNRVYSNKYFHHQNEKIQENCVVESENNEMRQMIEQNIIDCKKQFHYMQQNNDSYHKKVTDTILEVQKSSIFDKIYLNFQFLVILIIIFYNLVK